MERFRKLRLTLGKLDRARTLLLLGLLPVLGISALSAIFVTMTNKELEDTNNEISYLLLSGQLLEVESKLSQATTSSRVPLPGSNPATDKAAADRQVAFDAIADFRSEAADAPELLTPILGGGDPEALAATLDQQLADAQTILQMETDGDFSAELDRLETLTNRMQPLWEASADVATTVSPDPWSRYDQLYLSYAKYEQSWILERRVTLDEYRGLESDGAEFHQRERRAAFRSILEFDEPAAHNSQLLANSRIDQASVLAGSTPTGETTIRRWLTDATEISELTRADISQSIQKSVEARDEYVEQLRDRRRLIVAGSVFVLILAVILFLVWRSEIRYRRSVEKAHGEALDSLDDRSRRDPATGMWNRRQLNDELERCLDRQHSHGPVLLLYIDLDEFKPINDIWGHAMGDRILQVVSDRLRGTTLQEYSAIRFGGDEFILFGNKQGATVSSALELGEQVIEILSRPIALGNHKFNVSATAGVTVSDASSTSEELLLEADTVLIVTKRSARGTANSYDRATTRSSELLKALPGALESGEITCHFQPISDLSTGKLHHLEALARWIPLDGDPIPPSEFIPIVELFGLTTDLMSRVISDIAEFMHHPKFPSDVDIWFNISAKQFEQAELASQVLDKIQSHNLDPRRLGVEVSATSTIESSQNFNVVSSKLRNNGMGVALDNFGLRPSPLSILFDLEIDAVKIDRQLVLNIDKDQKFAYMVQGIVSALQHGPNNVKVIADGVETVEQLRWLKDSGVDYVQGFLSSGPHPKEQYIDSWKNRPSDRQTHHPENQITRP